MYIVSGDLCGRSTDVLVGAVGYDWVYVSGKRRTSRVRVVLVMVGRRSEQEGAQNVESAVSRYLLLACGGELRI
jgi:hypothetical protein